MEHTPGPWKAHRIGSEGPKGLAFRIESASGEPKETEVAVTYYKPFFEQADANARLIAQAPALLEVLGWAVREIENAANTRLDELSDWMNRLDFDELERARAAIELAKGNSP